MKKQLSAIFMLAGTAIGSGMISLPIVLSHIGLLPTILLISLCAVMTYISSLVRTELNLHSNCKFTLEEVGFVFSGTKAALIGNVSLKLLSFSLLSAYIYGLSSIISDGETVSKIIVATAVFLILTFSSHRIIALNRKLFIILLIVLVGSIIGMSINTDFSALPQIRHEILLPKLCIIIPTLFTSFGFQGSLHSLTKFCNNDEVMIRKACFWGSLVPAIVYITWTLGVISLVFGSQPDLFFKMAAHGIDINELIAALCNISNAKFVKTAVFIISLLAILTSIIGVGIALIEDLETTFERFRIHMKEKTKRCACSATAIIPSALVAIIVPEAFVKVLGFAGMILSVIAIFLPSFLLSDLKEDIRFELLRRKECIRMLVMFGILTVICEIFSLI